MTLRRSPPAPTGLPRQSDCGKSVPAAGRSPPHSQAVDFSSSLRAFSSPDSAALLSQRVLANSNPRG